MENNLTQQFNKKEYYKIIAAIMIPVVLQNIISYALSTTDNVMVGLLGENELSAVGIANRFIFVYLMFVNGIVGGTTIIVSQYYGRRDLKSINSITGFSFMFCCFIGLLFSVICIAVPEQILSLYTKDVNLLALGAKYLKTVAFSNLFYAICNIIVMPLRSSGQTKLPLYFNTVGFVLNTILNYILIFGNFGMPKLGVAGAGLATTISRGVVAVICIIYMFKIDVEICLNIKDMLKQKVLLIKDIIRYGCPYFLNDFIWSIGITSFSAIMGRLGVKAVAAYNIVSLVENFSFILAGGLGAAASIVIGRELGQSNYDMAKKYSRMLIKDAFFIGLFMTLIVIIAAKPFISLFNVSAEAADTAYKLIWISACFVIIRGVKYIISTGILRSGGNTLFCAICDISILYFIGIPLSFLFAFVFKLPIHIVYIAMCINEFFALIVSGAKYLKGNWAKNITKDLN